VVTFGYEMRMALDDRKLATGHTKHIFLGTDFRPAKLPEKYLAMFGIRAKSEPNK
jgi:acyl-CoA thioesterase FadM